MFAAQMHNKLCRHEEDMEDLLTSNVFGVWRYLPPHLGLVQLLQTAERLDGARLSIGATVLAASLSFWPWLSQQAGKSAEPDVLVELTLSDSSKVLVMVEAKFHSPKSSLPDDSTFPNDQLARQMQILRALARKTRARHYGLVYITAHTAIPRDDLQEAIDELRSKTGDGSDEHFYWTTWRSLPEIISDSVLEEARSQSAGGATMLADLHRIVCRLGLAFFSGFGPEAWQAQPGLWEFSLPSRSFGWSAFSMRTCMFESGPARFPWLAIRTPQDKTWRFDKDE